MQQILEFIPVMGFLITYLFSKDIFFATGALIILNATVFLLLKSLNKNISKSFKTTFGLVLVFGGLTLFFRNQEFIQWKPTIFYWCCSCFLLAYRLKGREAYALKNLFGEKLQLPNSAWSLLTYSWASILLIIGFLNLWVAYTFPLDTWVTFKVVGLPVLSLLVILGSFAHLIYTKQISVLDMSLEENKKAEKSEDKKQVSDVNQ